MKLFLDKKRDKLQGKEGWSGWLIYVKTRGEEYGRGKHAPDALSWNVCKKGIKKNQTKSPEEAKAEIIGNRERRKVNNFYMFLFEKVTFLCIH